MDNKTRKFLVKIFRKTCLTLRDGQSGTPLILQDIQADTSVGIYVGMVNSGDKVNLWGLEWVVSGEMNVQEENTSSIRTVILKRVRRQGTLENFLTGPIMVACQWNWSFSSWGPAEQFAGGSLPRSISSFWILLRAMGYCEFDEQR